MVHPKMTPVVLMESRGKFLRPPDMFGASQQKRYHFFLTSPDFRTTSAWLLVDNDWIFRFR